jgi:hypothetical protein
VRTWAPDVSELETVESDLRRHVVRALREKSLL